MSDNTRTKRTSVLQWCMHASVVDWSPVSTLWKWQNGVHDITNEISRWRTNCILPVSQVQVVESICYYWYDKQ